MIIKAKIIHHQSLDNYNVRILLYFRPKIPRAGWSDWGSWQPQGSDDDTEMIRTRACDNPAPMFGGKCEGEAEQNVN